MTPPGGVCILLQIQLAQRKQFEQTFKMIVPD